MHHLALISPRADLAGGVLRLLLPPARHAAAQRLLGAVAGPLPDLPFARRAADLVAPVHLLRLPRREVLHPPRDLRRRRAVPGDDGRARRCVELHDVILRVFGARPGYDEILHLGERGGWLPGLQDKRCAGQRARLGGDGCHVRLRSARPRHDKVLPVFGDQTHPLSHRAGECVLQPPTMAAHIRHIRFPRRRPATNTAMVANRWRRYAGVMCDSHSRER